MHNQLQSGPNKTKTMAFPSADRYKDSDNDLMLLNFRLMLKEINNPKNIRLVFNHGQTVGPLPRPVVSNFNKWEIYFTACARR